MKIRYFIPVLPVFIVLIFKLYYAHIKDTIFRKLFQRNFRTIRVSPVIHDILISEPDILISEPDIPISDHIHVISVVVQKSEDDERNLPMATALSHYNF